MKAFKEAQRHAKDGHQLKPSEFLPNVVFSFFKLLTILSYMSIGNRFNIKHDLLKEP